MKTTLIAYVLLLSYSAPLMASSVKSSVAARNIANTDVQTETYGSDLYIHEGLIALFDGIENIGRGKRNPFSATWVNLIDKVAISIGNNEWGENYVLRNGSGIKLPNYIFSKVSSKKEYTVEAVFRPMGIGGNYTEGPFRFEYQVVNTGWNNSSKTAQWVTGYYAQNRSISWEPLQIGTMCSQNICLDGVYYTKGYFNGGLVLPEMTWRDNQDRISSRGIVGVGFYDGGAVEIYCFRLYDRALSDDEVAYNYLVDKERFGL